MKIIKGLCISLVLLGTCAVADVVKFTDLPVLYEYKDGKDGVDAGYVALANLQQILVNANIPYIKAPDKELADGAKDLGIFAFIRLKGSYQKKDDFLIFIPDGLQLNTFHAYFVTCPAYECKNNPWRFDLRGFHKRMIDCVRKLNIPVNPYAIAPGNSGPYLRALGYVEPYRAELEKAFEASKLQETEKNPQK